jgi:long-chain-fatty-acid---luciferin-component ligase
VSTQEALDFKPLGAVGPVDRLIYHSDDPFRMERDAIETLQTELIGGAFRLHHDANEDYARYCRRLGVGPSDVSEWPDLARIPLLTSTQFKLREVLSCAPADVVKVCISSSTQGSISRVHRDETTLSRFLGSVQASIESLLGLDDCFCLHLGPSTREARDLWIAYAMSVVEMVYPTEHFVTDGIFDAERALDRLEATKDSYDAVLLLGPPIMLLRLVDAMHAAGRRIEGCESVVVVTAGGWKRFSGEAIPRAEFEALVAENLQGIASDSFRDCFNMVELNTLLVECEQHHKHVPPWLRLLALDPETLEPAAEGELGLLACLDPTPTSYPGFLLADDFARVREIHRCGCGRVSQTFEPVRRVSRVEARGCALKIDRSYAAQGAHG